MISQAIRALVVDDSAVVRGLLTRALETDSQIVVAGTAMHGELALSWLRKNEADVVILDVEMPVMDGLTCLEHIQKTYPKLPVVMASSLTYQGAETTIKALALGAADCIAKPAASSMAESIEQLVLELVPLVKALGGLHSQATTSPSAPRCAIVPHASRPTFNPKILVIGASTGGPKALTAMLTALPEDFQLPILIVQHMPPMFTPMLARHLAADSNRPCQEAAQGGPILRHHTFVAPGNYHVVIEKQDGVMVTTLNQDPQEHYCRPSVNPLFESAASWYGKSVLAVMLTGMGSDGIEGTRAIVERGGYVISQDEETSVVWGMPAAVANEDLADEVLPIDQIGAAILKVCSPEVCRK